MPERTRRLAEPERVICASIMRRARACGAFAEKLHGGQFQRAGLPDIIICYGGRFIAVEVKRPGRKATPLQQHVLDEIADAGGVAIVATCWDDVAGAMVYATRQPSPHKESLTNAPPSYIIKLKEVQT